MGVKTDRPQARVGQARRPIRRPGQPPPWLSWCWLPSGLIWALDSVPEGRGLACPLHADRRGRQEGRHERPDPPLLRAPRAAAGAAAPRFRVPRLVASHRDVGHFDEWSESYDRSRLQREIFDPVHEHIVRVASREVPSAQVLLDVGCGTGRLLERVGRA